MRRLVLVAWSALFAACGGGGGSRPGDAAVPRDAAVSAPDLAVPAPDLALSPADLVASAYPPGPYGYMPGETIAPLVWVGYVVPQADAVATSKPYGAYSMDELRRSGAPYGLVHVSEFY